MSDAKYRVGDVFRLISGHHAGARVRVKQVYHSPKQGWMYELNTLADNASYCTATEVELGQFARPEPASR